MHPPEPSSPVYPFHPTSAPGGGEASRLGPALGWAVSLWVLAGLTLVGALLCAALSGYGFWIANHMEDNGVTTSAVITEVSEDGDRTVEFTTEDGEVVTESIDWLSMDDPQVGDSIDVTYDPDDVTYVLPAGSKEDRAFAIGFMVASIVGLLVASAFALGAVLVHRARSRSLSPAGVARSG